MADADLIVFVGSDFPFGRNFFNPSAKFIQVDIDAAKFGRRHNVDQSVLGDGATALRRWVELGTARPADAWLKANQENIRLCDANARRHYTSKIQVANYQCGLFK